MKYRYVSIDTEPLGLNPETCDLIEFAAVLDDLVSPIHELPVFHRYIINGKSHYQGHPLALARNAIALQRIHEENPLFRYCWKEDLDLAFSLWLNEHQADGITIAGKNFAALDLPFLRKIGFGGHSKCNRRILDVGSMYYNPTIDKEVPSLDECLRRSGASSDVVRNDTSDIFIDAKSVVSCIRARYMGQSTPNEIRAIQPRKYVVIEETQGEVNRHEFETIYQADRFIDKLKSSFFGSSTKITLLDPFGKQLDV